MTLKEALDIVCDVDIFQDKSMSELSGFRYFKPGNRSEWERFWKSEQTALEYLNYLGGRTDVSQDEKREMEECYPQLLLLEKLRKFK